MKSYLRYSHASFVFGALCAVTLSAATLNAADENAEGLAFALPDNEAAAKETAVEATSSEGGLAFALPDSEEATETTSEAASSEDGLAFALPDSEEAGEEAIVSDEEGLMFALPTDGEVPGESSEGSGDEDVFLLPEFTVSTTQDRGYFSANTLSGTRTNQLIKNTPMTISVVNADLMEDLNLTEVSSLEKVVASIQDEGEAFTNSVVRFRGLLTKNQLFEFMQRKLGQDSYNVDRVEVIRGANSLVYGQAAPGGKANYLAKKALFGDNKTEIKGEIGENNLYRASIDHNVQVNDKIAVRMMATYYDRDYSQDYKSKTLDGQTLAVSYRPTDKTRINLHFERYYEERISPRSAYLDRSGEYGLTGILEDLPATPDIVKYLPDNALNDIINYNDGTLTSNDTSSSNNPPSDPNVPQLNIDSARDLKLWYEKAGIDEDNFGYGSPDLERERYGSFIMGDITHQITDDLAVKLAYSHEEYNGETRQLATSGDIFLSATSRGYLRPDGFEPDLDASGDNQTYDGSDPDTMPSAYIIPTWEESDFSDDTDSIRTTLSWNTEYRGSKQQFILGLDYDRRESEDTQYQQVLPGTVIAPDGSWSSSTYRSRDYVLLEDYHNGYNDARDFNYSTELSPNFNPDANFSNSRTNNGTPGDEAAGADSFYALRRQRESTVETQALWLANQGAYMNGRLNTLVGVRFDRIELDAVSDQVQTPDQDPVPIDETYTSTSPSVGALFWINENIGVFANYAESIESPTGWVINPIGESVPAETGVGYEGGVKFEFLEGKLSGQLTFFDITKENDSLSTLGTPQLERLYPWSGTGDGPYDFLYDDDGSGFAPIGRNVAGIDTNSQGVELDVYYNPTRSLSLFLGYAFADATFEDGPDDEISGLPLVEDGQRVPGTAQHSANFTAKYSFKEGQLKGWYLGCNLKYRSKSFYNRLYADTGRDARYTSSGRLVPGGVGPDFYDGRPDLFSNVDENGQVYAGATTKSYDVWLDDTFNTGVFFGWSGRLFNKASDAPKYSFQLSVDNLFDDRDLIATGNNPRYTDGRRVTFRTSIKF